MNIAVPVWNGRLSTLLDTARSVLLLETEGSRITKRRHVDFLSTEVLRKVIDLAEADVHLIICEALSREMSELLQMHGISVLQGRSGAVDDVIAAHMTAQAAHHGSAPLERHGERTM